MIKFKTESLDKACECPFYVQTTDGSRKCFIKSMVPLQRAMDVIEGENSFKDNNDWKKDCNGSLDNCNVIPLLYTLPIVQELPEIDAISEFNPFEEETIQEENSEEDLDIEILLYRKNPYLVQTDILVYPTNQALIIDDEEFNVRTGGSVQEECEYRYKDEILKMGNVYPTSNGTNGHFQSKVAAKKIYHAIVAGCSRLVLLDVIRKSTTTALMLANIEKAQDITFMPADCGTYDVSEVAVTQLSAINNFLNTIKQSDLYLKKISIVMLDQESLNIYENYFKNIFEEN